MFVSLREVNGVSFFSLRKNTTADSLFLSEFVEKGKCDRPVSRTTIIETIRSLKDKAVYCACGLSDRSRKHWSKEATAKLMVLEDTFGTVTIPEMYGHGPFDIKVVLNKPGVAVELMVEASVDVFTYLKKIMTAQLQSYDTESKPSSSHAAVGCKGVSVTRKHGRECVRAIVKDDKGKTTNKFIRIDQHGGSIASAAAEAQEWLNNKQRSMHSPSDGEPPGQEEAD